MSPNLGSCSVLHLGDFKIGGYPVNFRLPLFASTTVDGLNAYLWPGGKLIFRLVKNDDVANIEIHGGNFDCRVLNTAPPLAASMTPTVTSPCSEIVVSEMAVSVIKIQSFKGLWLSERRKDFGDQFIKARKQSRAFLHTKNLLYWMLFVRPSVKTCHFFRTIAMCFQIIS